MAVGKQSQQKAEGKVGQRAGVIQYDLLTPGFSPG
jgi:hypothetical protein